MKIAISDIEANGLFNLSLDKKKRPKTVATKIHCIAVMDYQTKENKLFEPHELKKALDYLNSFDMVVGHNFIGFDAPVIKKFLGKLTTRLFDTCLFSQMMYPDKYDMPIKDHSEESWGNFLGNKKAKYTGGWEEYNKEMGQYCLQDVSTNADIYTYQMKHWDKTRIPEKSLKLEEIIAEIGAEEIGTHGFLFDVKKIPEVQQKLESECSELMFKLKQTFPDEYQERISEKTGKVLKPKLISINSKSHTKIGYYFQKYLGYEFDKDPDTGNWKTDKDNMLLCPAKEATWILEHRDRKTLLSYFNDWRTRAEINPYITHSLRGVGTQTGRASHSDPNLAQVSKESHARSLFLPHPGEVLVGSDIAGLELRLLAHYLAIFGSREYVDIVLNGDVHWYNGQLAGIIPEGLVRDKENPEHEELRNIAKTFIYGWLYGAGAAKIGKIIGSNARQGAKLKDQFLDAVPGLRPLQEDVARQVFLTKGIKLVDGRIVPARSARTGLNTLLQGSGAMVCKLWLALVYKKKLELLPKAKILAWVHDEIQSSVPPQRAKDLGNLKVSMAKEAGRRFKLEIPIDADYAIGNNWKETH